MSALEPVVDLVFPPRCPLCGAALASQGGLCAECWHTLVIPGEPSCARCQRPLVDVLRVRITTRRRVKERGAR